MAGGYTLDLVATNTTDGQLNTTDQTLTVTVTSKLPLIRHVFQIVLENNDYATTFGTPSNDPYLAQTLPSEGALLENYYATGHYSNDNYISLVSGQPANSDNQIDCLSYSDFGAGEGQDAQGIQQGAGCVYPTAVKTIADQLSSEGLTWKGYMEDMGNDPTRDGTDGTSCGHPTSGIGAFFAETSDGYVTRHNPFVYFHSITGTGTTPECDQDDVPLGDTSGNMPAGTLPGVTGLATDLQSIATTPNYSLIVPNLCDDGHDGGVVPENNATYACTNTTGAAAGGDPTAADPSVADTNAWLQTWVPIITNSPAFKADGLLEITFDEAEQPTADYSECCGETAGPAASNGMNGIAGAARRQGRCHPDLAVHHPRAHGDEDVVQPLLVVGLDRGPVRVAPVGRGPDRDHHVRQEDLLQLRVRLSHPGTTSGRGPDAPDSDHQPGGLGQWGGHGQHHIGQVLPLRLRDRAQGHIPAAGRPGVLRQRRQRGPSRRQRRGQLGQ